MVLLAQNGLSFADFRKISNERDRARGHRGHRHRQPVLRVAGNEGDAAQNERLWNICPNPPLRKSDVQPGREKAGIAGIGAAYVGVRALLWLAPKDLPRLDEIALDGELAAEGPATVAAHARAAPWW
jgi:hypothetical protein